MASCNALHETSSARIPDVTTKAFTSSWAPHRGSLFIMPQCPFKPQQAGTSIECEFSTSPVAVVTIQSDYFAPPIYSSTRWVLQGDTFFEIAFIFEKRRE